MKLTATAVAPLVVVLATCPRAAGGAVVVPPAAGGKPGQVTCSYTVAVPDRARHTLVASAVPAGAGAPVASGRAQQEVTAPARTGPVAGTGSGAAVPGACAYVSDSPLVSRRDVLVAAAHEGAKPPPRAEGAPGSRVCGNKTFTYAEDFETSTCGVFRVGWAEDWAGLGLDPWEGGIPFWRGGGGQLGGCKQQHETSD